MADKKYIEYLKKLGFHKCTREIVEKYIPTEFDYIYDASWYFFEGNLETDYLEMSNLPLLVTGNLTIHNGIVHTVDYNGLVVLGKTKARSFITNGNTFLEEAEFSVALVSSGNGAPRIINFLEGPFVYNDSDSTSIGNTQKVSYYLELENGWGGEYKGFFDTIVDAYNYFEEPQDWNFISKEDFEKNYTDDEYLSYEEYLFNEVGVNSTEIEKAIINDELKIKTLTRL